MSQDSAQVELEICLRSSSIRLFSFPTRSQSGDFSRPAQVCGLLPLPEDQVGRGIPPPVLAALSCTTAYTLCCFSCDLLITVTKLVLGGWSNAVCT